MKNSGNSVLRKLEHTYDPVDNITEIVETRGSAVTKTFYASARSTDGGEPHGMATRFLA